MHLDIERQHMKTTKQKMRPGKAAKKVSMQRLYECPCKDSTATERGEGKHIKIGERIQQQILMSGSVRKRVMALGPLVSKKKERHTEKNGKRRKKGLEEKGENTERR